MSKGWAEGSMVRWSGLEYVVRVYKYGKVYRAKIKLPTLD